MELNIENFNNIALDNVYKIVSIPNFIPFNRIVYEKIYEKDYFVKYIPKQFSKGNICIISNIGEFYFKDSKLHRENGPCISYLNGTREWYQNGNYDMRLF